MLDIWDAVGAGAAIAAEGLTWTTARTFHRDRELFSYDVAGAGPRRFPPFVNLSQSRTEELLDAAIAAQPLIDVRWGRRVVGLDQDGGGVTVQLRGRRRAGLARRGVRRAVAATRCARRSGVTFEGETFDDRFLICDVRVDLPGWATERRFWFDPEWNPGRQVLIHPCPDSTFRIDWQVPAGLRPGGGGGLGRAGPAHPRDRR